MLAKQVVDADERGHAWVLVHRSDADRRPAGEGIDDRGLVLIGHIDGCVERRQLRDASAKGAIPADSAVGDLAEQTDLRDLQLWALASRPRHRRAEASDDSVNIRVRTADAHEAPHLHDIGIANVAIEERDDL